MGTRDHPRTTVEAIVVGRAAVVATGVASLLWAGGLALAGDSDSRLRRDAPARLVSAPSVRDAEVRRRLANRWTGESGQFLRSHLLPRVRGRLANIEHADLVAMPARPFPADAFSEDLVATTRHQVESATRKAIKSYLIEATTLGEWIDAFRSARPGGRSAPSAEAGREAGFDLDVGIAHGLPELVVQRSAGRGELRVRVGGHGELGFEYLRAARARSARIVADADPLEDRYALACRLGF